VLMAGLSFHGSMFPKRMTFPGIKTTQGERDSEARSESDRVAVSYQYCEERRLTNTPSLPDVADALGTPQVYLAWRLCVMSPWRCW
jgi:hypothetical protein